MHIKQESAEAKSQGAAAPHPKIKTASRHWVNLTRKYKGHAYVWSRTSAKILTLNRVF